MPESKRRVNALFLETLVDNAGALDQENDLVVLLCFRDGLLTIEGPFEMGGLNRRKRRCDAVV